MNHNTQEFGDAIHELTRKVNANRSMIRDAGKAITSAGIALIGMSGVSYFLYRMIKKLERKIEHLEGMSDAGLHADLNKTHEKGHD